jgi:hypothetical protein
MVPVRQTGPARLRSPVCALPSLIERLPMKSAVSSLTSRFGQKFSDYPVITFAEISSRNIVYFPFLSIY